MQTTAYELRISDWSSDLCSSDPDARASALRFVIGNRLVAPEPVDNARLFEARKRLNDAIFAEAGSLHDGVMAGEQRPGAIVDDAGQELEILDAGPSERTVTNERRGFPPLRHRLPLVERCGTDHLAHQASLAARHAGPQIGRAHVCTPVPNT